jgi:hypothetical protein
MKNAVSPPTMWDLVAGVGRGQLVRVKPGGVALDRSAPVDEEVIQVSVRAKTNVRLCEIGNRSVFDWIEEGANSAYLERVGAKTS